MPFDIDDYLRRIVMAEADRDSMVLALAEVEVRARARDKESARGRSGITRRGTFSALERVSSVLHYLHYGMPPADAGESEIAICREIAVRLNWPSPASNGSRQNVASLRDEASHPSP
jgi:hypothetical protein